MVSLSELPDDVAYSTLSPHVHVHAYGAPEPSVIHAIRKACIHFCKETGYLQPDFDPFNLINNTPDYQVDVPDGYIIERFVDPLYVNGMVVRSINPARLPGLYGEDWRQITGTPTAYVCFDPGTITFIPFPDANALAAGAIKITGQYILGPTVASTAFNGDILERYHVLLTYGALASLLMEPGQPYSDPQKALLFERKFEAGINAVKNAVSKQHVGAPQRVQFRRVY